MLLKLSQSGKGNYRDVPHGKYEVKIEKLELVESKRVTQWFHVG